MPVMSTNQSLSDLLEQRPSVTLDALAPLSLLDRIDSKFVVHQEQLRQVLARLDDEYFVLEIDGIRASSYLTTYFDTPDFAMYLDHHNGKRSRYKVRCRTYMDSGAAFVEVKVKTNKERTVKYRRPVPAHLTSLSTLDCSWLPLTFPYQVDDLHAVVWNRFTRITLASFKHRERITIDANVTFGSGPQSFSYLGLCIVEVKQPKFSLVHSPFARQLHQMHLQPQAFSKFCIAATYFYAGCKTNRFKPLLLYLARTYLLRDAHERVA